MSPEISEVNGVRSVPVCISRVCCSISDVCVHGDLRLVGGTHPREGRVEICYFNQWGTICDDLWGQQDANVACKQLGFRPTGKEEDKL